jgi:hypothetical protein
VTEEDEEEDEEEEEEDNGDGGPPEDSQGEGDISRSVQSNVKHFHFTYLRCSN